MKIILLFEINLHNITVEPGVNWYNSYWYFKFLLRQDVSCTLNRKRYSNTIINLFNVFNVCISKTRLLFCFLMLFDFKEGVVFVASSKISILPLNTSFNITREICLVPNRNKIIA